MPTVALLAILACVADARRMASMATMAEEIARPPSDLQYADPAALTSLLSFLFAYSPSTSSIALQAAPVTSHTLVKSHTGERSRTALPSMQFSNPFDNLKNPFVEGATTVVLSIGFSVPERGPNSVLSKLDALALKAETDTAEGIADLCADTALLLLRRKAEWISTYGSAQHKSDEEESLKGYDRLAIKEAAKFDDRDSDTSRDNQLIAARLKEASGAATLAVVTIVACIVGDTEKELQAGYGGAAAMEKALQELSAAAGDVDNVLAFELFWVPGDDKDVLDNEEIITDWPELMQI
jgi:hypothetical protein